MKLKHYILMIICLTATACVSVLYGDFKIRGGTIINQNSGPLVFDLTNDGNANVTMSANGKMGFGSSAPTSTFDLTGSLGLNSQVFSADGAISGNSMIFGDTSVGSISLTLPSPSTVTGRIYHIKKISENNSLIITSSTNIDNSANVTLTTSGNGFPYLNVYSSGTQWFISSMSN